MSDPGVELSIIVPTYNEKENISELLSRIASCLAGQSWEVIFVDDDSPDGTADLVRALAQDDRHIRCIQRINRRGLSSACIEGMLASSAPYLAVMDADLQHDERLLRNMLETLQEGECDLVVASRYSAGGGVGDWDPVRTWISRLATRLSRIVLRVSLSDPMSGFFMIRRSVFLGRVRQLSGVGFKILLDVISSSSQPLHLKELPYTFRSRQFGESKLDGQVGWEYLLMLLDKLLGQFIPVGLLAFALVGGLGMVVHLLTLAFLFEGMKISFLNSQIVAAFIAMTFNFALNNVLAYSDFRPRGWHWIQCWASFSLACSIGAFANVSIASHLFEKGTEWIIAALVGISVSAVWNDAMTRAYTRKKPSAV